MKHPSNNRYDNDVVPATDWDMTGDAEPICVGHLLPSRDVIPLIKRMYGIPNVENPDMFDLEHKWASNNEDTASFFFDMESTSLEVKTMIGCIIK